MLSKSLCHSLRRDLHTRGRGSTHCAMRSIARGMRMYASRPLVCVIGWRSLDLLPRAAIYWNPRPVD